MGSRLYHKIFTTPEAVHFIGRGLGYIILPHVEDKVTKIPDKPAFLVESISASPGLFSNFVMEVSFEYQRRKNDRRTSNNSKKYVSSFSFKCEVNFECDLWN